jgi:hypothetical protein
MIWDYPASSEITPRLLRTSPGGKTAGAGATGRRTMPDVVAERRNAQRYSLVLAADIVELPRGARLSARTTDLSRTGCYFDTLNPVAQGAQVRVRITHRDEVFETVGKVVYVSPGLGMGVLFTDVEPAQLARLDGWLAEI